MNQPNLKEGTKYITHIGIVTPSYLDYDLRRFYIWLSQQPKVDVMCYTFNYNLLIPRNKNWRVICAKIFGDIPRELKYRLYKNIHAKLYIVGDKAWVGSWNFNSPTYFEFIYPLRQEDVGGAKSYFRNLW